MTHPLLLHSVSYAGLWGQAALGVEAVVDRAADLGFDGVMLMAKRPHVSPLDYGPAERERLRRKLDGKPVVLAGYCNLTGDLEHGEIPHRELNVVYLEELARLAADLGATSVRVFTGYEHPSGNWAAQWRLIADTLREAAERAEAHGVALGIQNHHDHAVGWRSLLDLLAAVGHPNAKAMFDAWAPALHGEDLRECARALAPHTIHTTVADYQLRPRHRYQPALVNYEPAPPYTVAVPMGEGTINYRAFFTGLDEGGFTGTVSYEMCSPLAGGGDLATLDRYARRFVEWMMVG